jgi:hypothetical protein
MNAEVECYSGMEYAERPLRFLWQEEWRGIRRIVAERRTVDGKEFDVLDERNEKFLLVYGFAADRWKVIPQQEAAGIPGPKRSRHI